MENFLKVVSDEEQTDINRSSAIAPFTVFLPLLTRLAIKHPNQTLYTCLYP
jgi:hypothetical protein